LPRSWTTRPTSQAFGKNYLAVGFKIDYVKADGELSTYTPDFLVRTTDGVCGSSRPRVGRSWTAAERWRACGNGARMPPRPAERRAGHATASSMWIRRVSSASSRRRSPGWRAFREYQESLRWHAKRKNPMTCRSREARSGAADPAGQSRCRRSTASSCSRISARSNWSGTARRATFARRCCRSSRWSTSTSRAPKPRSQEDLFDSRGRQQKGWTNKLIWGDNKLILSSLKAGALRQQIEDAGGLKLIYIDPPFDVGADFSMDIEIGGETFHKEANLLEQIAYRDTWGRGADSFISMIYERLILMRERPQSDSAIPRRSLSNFSNASSKQAATKAIWWRTFSAAVARPPPWPKSSAANGSPPTWASSASTPRASVSSRCSASRKPPANRSAPSKSLNLGRYERQAYLNVGSRLSAKKRADALAKKEREFRELILKAYKAQPLEGESFFHGKNAGRLVVVGPINHPVGRLFVEEVITGMPQARGVTGRHPRLRV
jgi:hypothetical protein